eukprot:4652772-Prymnesium_polylepis.1
MRTVSVHAHVSQPAAERLGASEVAALLGGKLAPLGECRERCGLMGWCMRDAARAAPRCHCFPEAVRTSRGSCAAVRYAELAARGTAGDGGTVGGGTAPDAAWRRWWDAARSGGGFVGRAADGSGALPLVE